MDALLRNLLDWIEIESTTGVEGDYGEALARVLGAEGLGVERQEVAPGRWNILARAAVPEVVFCTHLDTVPPYYGSRVEGGVVHGRGSCDAKGQAAAMVAAAKILLAAGEERIGFLFTVGEETDGIGATRANSELPRGPAGEEWAPRFTIIGEPTEGRFVAGHKGVLKATLRARGVAGHSSQDCGPSAVHELVCCSHAILNDSWGSHPLFGPGTINLGQIRGGVAANVVADRAEADLMVRTVEDPAVVTARLRGHLSEAVELVSPEVAYGPVQFHVPGGAKGEQAPVVAFGTDAVHLPRWGTPLLMGAGSIRDAHTDHECVSLSALERVVSDHVKTVTELLATSGTP
ncbi:MAG: M20/M25/M40 family metallo-hydrolase [Planctomycetota bacterium]|jgi:acetylornithine deacetylase|nr:M20/M25/M40 family metallo-hydrolase [Planctomycetota bacterium]